MTHDASWLSDTPVPDWYVMGDAETSLGDAGSGGDAFINRIVENPSWRSAIQRPAEYEVGEEGSPVGDDTDGGEEFVNLLFGVLPFASHDAPTAIFAGVIGHSVAPGVIHAGIPGTSEAPVVAYVGRRATTDGPVNLSIAAGLHYNAPTIIIADVLGTVTEAPTVVHIGRSDAKVAPVVLAVGVLGAVADAPALILNGPLFEWVPDLSQVKESMQYRTQITRFESGREQRRAKGSGRRQWQLRFQKGTVDTAAIWDFYIDRHGVVRGFWWRNPVDHQTYLVRFADQILSMDALWSVLHRFGLRFIEVK